MTAIHQFVPTFEPSAVGNHMVRVRTALRDKGFESEIFAEFRRGAFENDGVVHSDYGSRYPARADDILIYHMAIGSHVADFLDQRPERLALYHHNMTPVELYQPWEPGVTYGMVWGRSQLKTLATRAALGFSPSEFNRRELEVLDYRQTTVAPLLVDFDSFNHSVDEATLERLLANKETGGADWLFVGWIAPHKCQHDIIRAFSMYRQVYDPHARLHLIGRVSAQTYLDACQSLVAELGQQDNVIFHGAVSDGDLGAHYRAADVLVSMSEHEGVGIPLLEAMHYRVPVIAHAAAAVPETVADAGILVADKRPAKVAAAVNRVLTDQALRQALVARGAARLEHYSLPRSRERLFEALRLLD